MACACAEYPFRNAIASLLLTPLFGIPSGIYKLHHKVMHHVVSTAATPPEGSRPRRQSKFAQYCSLLRAQINHSTRVYGPLLQFPETLQKPS